MGSGSSMVVLMKKTSKLAQTGQKYPDMPLQKGDVSGQHTASKTYGLMTTIAMIVGIVVGSGIYFRADDVYLYTSGNLALGIMALTLAAICIIFGSLTFSYLAIRTETEGGLVGYFAQFVSKKSATGYGWFFLYVYCPAITTVVAWAAAIYTFMLLGIEASLGQQILLGLAYTAFLLLLNILSRQLGGYLQNLSTVIKMIPLILIAFYGIFLAPPLSGEALQVPSFAQEFSKFGWITALVPLMYSYDGWTLALNIAPEVVDAKRNMKKALIISPLIVLATYVLYMVGIYKTLGGPQIIALGDDSIYVAAKQIFGDRWSNVVLVVVIISVLGVLNGLILSSIRLPQALADQSIIPGKSLARISPKLQLSPRSAGLFGLLVLAWTLIHYLVMKFNLFNGGDVSEISIAFNYAMYIILYLAVFRLGKAEQNKQAMIVSVLAMLGSCLILAGSILSSPLYVLLFFSICLSVYLMGLRYSKQQNQ